ncbi:MAG: DUF4276 family protein [Deltaproteobacteria bacterium]|nr:DUF4276 family protein [Deltaproteobacteria bacterium]
MSVEHVEFLVEEPSMEAALRIVLPRVLGGLSFEVYACQCKDELLERLPTRLLGYASWIPEDWRVVVIVDRDEDDCDKLKARLEGMATSAGLLTRTKAASSRYLVVVNRLAIEELEASYFGDWEAVRFAYPRVPATIPRQARYTRSEVETHRLRPEAREPRLDLAVSRTSVVVKEHLPGENEAWPSPSSSKEPDCRYQRPCLRQPLGFLDVEGYSELAAISTNLASPWVTLLGRRAHRAPHEFDLAMSRVPIGVPRRLWSVSRRRHSFAATRRRSLARAICRRPRDRRCARRRRHGRSLSSSRRERHRARLEAAEPSRWAHLPQALPSRG